MQVRKITQSIILASVALCVAACSPESTVQENQSYVELSTPVASSTAPSSSPTATAETKHLSHDEIDQSKAKLSQTLSALLSFNTSPSTTEIREYLTKEGIPSANLQISATKTPTGLKADATEIGWANTDTCIMGFIADAKSSVSILPALPDGSCFVGVSNGR